jgi:transcriptional regulator with XRE-family HTH domain
MLSRESPTGNEDRMSVPRTYVSKVENEKATPTLSSLERLAKALRVKVPDLLFAGERDRQEALRELTDDGFVRQVLAFAARLNKVQMTTILARVADLTGEQSRYRIVR